MGACNRPGFTTCRVCLRTAGKVKNQTPKVWRCGKKKKLTGRAKMRKKYNKKIKKEEKPILICYATIEIPIRTTKKLRSKLRLCFDLPDKREKRSHHQCWKGGVRGAHIQQEKKLTKLQRHLHTIADHH